MVVSEIFLIHERIGELRQLGDDLLQETIRYAENTAFHLLLAVVAYLFLCVVFYCTMVYLKTNPEYGHLQGVKRVLFVIAHPDDECMFFGPIIVKLAQRDDCQLYLLCLSEGDYEGKGKVRRRELWDACALLGIPDSNIMLCRNTYLPDDPAIRWREDVAANIVLNHVESLGIDTLITFDKAGVSGHSNHTSIFLAVAYLCMERKMPAYCRVFALESINILRKYSGIIDITVSFMLSTYWYLINMKEREIVKAAMAAHKSQYVWYRRLYMRFSRYTTIATLREVDLLDLEFDFELDD